jgi:outer membrane protein OmpA-like peptidoglycan-associated protein
MRTCALPLLALLTACSTVSVELMTLPVTEIAVAPEPKEPPAPVALAKIEIEDQIQFATWKATILEASFPVLDGVAATMNDHPELELVEIQGHSAKTGQPKRTLDLSAKRAEAVRKYLMDKGVDAERLVAKGYGEEQPVADNATEEGRQQNRRVEFVVLRQKDGGGEMASASAGGAP